MKLKKKKKKIVPDIPALRQEEMTSTVRDFGPSVPTILVIAGKKLYTQESDHVRSKQIRSDCKSPSKYNTSTLLLAN